MDVPAARIVFSAADRSEIAAQVTEALATGALTLGRHTKALEESFAALHTPAGEPAPHAIAVSSGTAAIEIILRHLDVAGRDVVVPANTFFATAAAVVHAGGRPVLADVDAATFAMSPQTLLDALTPQTAVVVVVHIGGLVTPHIRQLQEICRQRGIVLVEDAAHAHGSSYDGRPAGTFGVAGAFSFYPTKVVTSGEGGIIITADPDLDQGARVFRDQGKAGFLGNVHTAMGYAWRMSELHAIVGEVHLRRLPEAMRRRQEVARRYDAALAAVDGAQPLVVPPECTSNYYKYVVLLPPEVDRTVFKKEVREHGVSLSGEVYELPLHRQPVFESLADRPLPVAEDICARHVCLPVHSDMTDAEVDQVIDTFTEVARATW